MDNKQLMKMALLVMVISLVGLALPSLAQVELRFDPPDTTLALGDVYQLSIVMDETQDVRSFEVWLRYDPDILTFIEGSPGLAFTESGCQLFQDAVEDSLGTLHGYVVIMGADCWVTGPGELFSWEFSGLANGITQIEVEDVALFAPQIGELSNVSLGHASVQIGFESGIPEPFPDGYILGQNVPNPFNPSTEISYWLPQAQAVSLKIFDTSGKLVRSLINGEMQAKGENSVRWNGKDGHGRQVAAGGYFYQLKAGERALTKRMLLLK